jgi:hypothetical protein
MPIPLLMFASTDGLHHPRFNTLRLGGGWARKLSRGDRVLLGHKDQVLFIAKVKGVQVGLAIDILAGHARGNHMELALQCQDPNNYDPKEAFDRRLAGLIKQYGPHKMGVASRLTVIALEPVKR